MLFYLSEIPTGSRTQEKEIQQKITIYFNGKKTPATFAPKRKTPKINVENMASIKKCPQKMKLIEDTSQEDLNYKNKLTAK